MGLEVLFGFLAFLPGVLSFAQQLVVRLLQFAQRFAI